MKHNLILRMILIGIGFLAEFSCSKETVHSLRPCVDCQVDTGQANYPMDFYVFAKNWYLGDNQEFVNRFNDVLNGRELVGKSVNVYTYMGQAEYEVLISGLGFRCYGGLLRAEVNKKDVVLYFKPGGTIELPQGLNNIKVRILIR